MKSIIIKIVIPLGLLSLWFFLNLKYISQHDYSLLSLVSLSKFESLSLSRSTQLIKGDIAKGLFTSKYPKLGIVSVRFLNHDRINQDKLEFRLKEENATDWYYRAIYNTDQFQTGRLFPFGFPPIENSAGKRYIFEIESVAGTLADSISVDSFYPAFVSQSIFTKSDLTSNPENIIYFLVQKTGFLVTDGRFLYFSLIYSLPLIFFFLIAIMRVSHKTIFTFLFLLVTYDVIQHTIFSDFMYTSVTIIWMIVLFKYRLDSDILKPQIVFLFLLMTLLATVNRVPAAEKAATWLYLSLAVGLTHFILKR